jgi:chromate reductase, NAD(P)H dehydrogenase (quinone)
MSDVKILGIAGSLRQGSFNRALLKNAQQLLPAATMLEIFELHGIPVFSEDDEKNPPPKVVEFKQKIRAADAIVFATPEYNYSIPGGLKNAIDWASRPYGDSAWIGKPAAIVGASIGRMGSARAQYHLRQVCVYLQVEALVSPEVMISNAHEFFDTSGKLTHESSRNALQELLQALVARVHLLRGKR